MGDDTCFQSSTTKDSVLHTESYLQLGRKAFSDDFEAWQIGPVIRKVYQKYCGFGASKIVLTYNTTVSQRDRTLIDLVINQKRELDPWNMVADIHKPGSPWDIVYQHGKGNYRIIPTQLIESSG